MINNHIETCAQLEKEPCISLISLHGEPIGQHFFSGWPGAYCLKCLEEDKDEICISTVCECPCHDSFWAEFKQQFNDREPSPTTVNDMSDSDYRGDWDERI